MTWVLLVIALGGSNLNSPALTSIEFANKADCENAKATLETNTLRVSGVCLSRPKESLQ